MTPGRSGRILGGCHSWFLGPSPRHHQDGDALGVVSRSTVGTALEGRLAACYQLCRRWGLGVRMCDCGAQSRRRRQRLRDSRCSRRDRVSSPPTRPRRRRRDGAHQRQLHCRRGEDVQHRPAERRHGLHGVGLSSRGVAGCRLTGGRRHRHDEMQGEKASERLTAAVSGHTPTEGTFTESFHCALRTNNTEMCVVAIPAGGEKEINQSNSTTPHTRPCASWCGYKGPLRAGFSCNLGPVVQTRTFDCCSCTCCLCTAPQYPKNPRNSACGAAGRYGGHGMLHAGGF